MSNRKVHLGQCVFVLASDGEVVRTRVSGISVSGYDFLNGSGSWTKHWFTFPEALVAAKAYYEAKKVQLRKQLRLLATASKRLKTDEYFEQVMKSPYKVVSTEGDSRRSRRLKRVHAPARGHLEVGSKVYVAITPHTTAKFYGSDLHRPYPYFVLETKVEEVHSTPQGLVYYTFSTPFNVRKHYTRRHEAIYDPQFSGQVNSEIPVVTFKEEKEALDAIEDIPF